MAETAAGGLETIEAQCCIAGGGPAGIMLGYLLARAGVSVVVLEKHADFLRDFRGDTVHPSTLQVMHELGLLDGLLALPHSEAKTLSAQVGLQSFTVADFTHLPVKCPFIAFLPQWHFLNHLAQEAEKFATFRLLMQAEARDLIVKGERVTGLVAETPSGTLRIKAGLVVGADGRRSRIREAAGLVPIDIGAPMDILWFSLSRRPDDGGAVIGRFGPGAIMFTIDRGDYFQCGYVIAKGGYEHVKSQGLDAFRQSVGVLAPQLRDRASELQDWDQVKLLTVGVDRLTTWHRPGLLCIGDAAHTMSPVGGVGINLALQDAVAAANILAVPLREGRYAEADLAAVQARRTMPVRLTQALQVAVARRIITRVLGSTAAFRPPLGLRIAARLPILQRLVARVIGIGFRPEHVETSPFATLDRAEPFG